MNGNLPRMDYRQYRAARRLVVHKMRHLHQNQNSNVY